MAKTKASTTEHKTPQPMLLALVAQFLEKNGFNSAHRIYNTERKKRPKKEGWEGTFAKDYTAKFPPLESIFQTWKDEHRKVDDSASDSEGVVSSALPNNTLISGMSDTSSDSEEDSTSESQSNEPSDSNTDSEMQKKMVKTGSPIVLSTSKTSSYSKSLKRKARESSSSSSDSASAEDKSTESESSSEEEQPTKKRRVQSPTASSASGTDSSSSSDSGSDSNPDSSSASASESDTESASDLLQAAATTQLPSSNSSSSEESSNASSGSESLSSDEIDETEDRPTLDKAPSDSSGTVIGDPKTTQLASDASSSEEAAGTTQKTDIKKRHVGARPTKLAALSATADLDDHVSNTYVSYEYADKAYRDLSITRGKGFTKEKNKKKRGSYRGGAIDISGGKAFKFDD